MQASQARRDDRLRGHRHRQIQSPANARLDWTHSAQYRGSAPLFFDHHAHLAARDGLAQAAISERPAQMRHVPAAGRQNDAARIDQKYRGTRHGPAGTQVVRECLQVQGGIHDTLGNPVFRHDRARKRDRRAPG
jgi:hypothetical protein